MPQLRDGSSNKFGILSGDAVTVIGAPLIPLDLIVRLAPHTEFTLGGRFDVVILFLNDREHLERLFQAAQLAMRSGARLWTMYPDNFKHPETDLGRERGWSSLVRAGYVVQEHIDFGDWHGIRWAEPARKFGRG